MPPITNADFRQHLRELRRDSIAWAELRTANHSRPDIKLVLQAVDDYFDNTRLLDIKAAVELASGITLTNTLSRKLWKVWMARKWPGE